MNIRKHPFSLLFYIALGSVFAVAETNLQDAPEKPTGYNSKLANLAAYGNGTLEIIDRDVS